MSNLKEKMAQYNEQFEWIVDDIKRAVSYEGLEEGIIVRYADEGVFRVQDVLVLFEQEEGKYISGSVFRNEVPSKIRVVASLVSTDKSSVAQWVPAEDVEILDCSFKDVSEFKKTDRVETEDGTQCIVMYDVENDKKIACQLDSGDSILSGTKVKIHIPKGEKL